MNTVVRAARHRFRLGAAIGATILALAAAVLVAQRLRLPESQLARLLAERLGVPVTIGGLSLGQAGAGVALHVRQLRIGPEGAPVLEARQVVVACASLSDALDLRIDELHLQAPVLRLARDAAGRLALPLPAGGDGGGRWPKVRVEQARLLLDASLGSEGELTLPRLQLTPTADGSLELAGEVRGGLRAPRALIVDLRVAARIGAGRDALTQIGIEGTLLDAALGEARALELRLAELRLSGGGAVDGRGLALRARLLRASGVEIGLSASAAESRLDGAGLRLAPLALELAGSAGGEPVRIAAAATALQFASDAVQADGLQVDAEASRGALSGRMSMQGELGFAPSGGLATLTAQRLEASLTMPGGRPLGFDGRAGLAADLAQRVASGSIDGRLDGEPLQLALHYRGAAEPPLQLIGRLRAIDLDHVGAVGGGTDGRGDDAQGAMPAWPLALDLRVDRLTRQGLVLEGTRLRYSPAPRQAAERAGDAG